ncbi:hypothetical protein SHKM778_40180 [Streptomyces sp. KM77-8]|uniref:NADP-dependent oxidoreductase domain-containing protein n=1 Tax=Streptomyces haneummycinicus TaxID=3074435 RepID=A0AAT9HJX9_9ACTN
MDERTFDRSQQHASVIGLGTWQLGADWGDVDDKEALAVLETAAESGVTLFDTADVYGDGRSEQTIASFIGGRPDLHVMVATKMGRRADQIPENYTLDNFRAWNDRSRRNLGVDRIDLVQLHCPPTPVYSTDEVFDALDTLVEEERVAAYGVSVETCAEALTAIARPNVASVQIILNPFRMKPLLEVLPAAREAGVGIIARVPLASGLLSGKYTRTPSSPRTTTVPSTGRARHSTRARPSPASTTRPVSRPPPSSPRSPPRIHPGPARPALDRPAARCHHRHPRRPYARPGPRQRGGRPAARAVRGDPHRDPGPLRAADQGPGRGPLVAVAGVTAPGAAAVPAPGRRRRRPRRVP